jgi:RNA polymerase sigma-70 factor (ECF subfamily)
VGDVANARAAVDAAFRSEWGRVVAHLIRVTGDWDLAEECAQDAFTKALERWPRDGIPTSPAGWLKTTARNRALDQLRRRAVGAAKLREVAMHLRHLTGCAAASPRSRTDKAGRSPGWSRRVAMARRAQAGQ